MKYYKRLIILFIAVLSMGMIIYAQNVIAAQPIPFDKHHWDFEAKSYKVETFKGQESLVFHKGLALVKGTEGFVNGIIEFDIAIPTKRGFSGPVWRVHGCRDRGRSGWGQRHGARGRGHRTGQ